MTGLQAGILYRKLQPVDEWVDDIDEDIVEMLIQEELEYDPLENILRLRN